MSFIPSIEADRANAHYTDRRVPYSTFGAAGHFILLIKPTTTFIGLRGSLMKFISNQQGQVTHVLVDGELKVPRVARHSDMNYSREFMLTRPTIDPHVCSIPTSPKRTPALDNKSRGKRGRPMRVADRVEGSLANS